MNVGSEMFLFADTRDLFSIAELCASSIIKNKDVKIQTYISFI